MKDTGEDIQMLVNQRVEINYAHQIEYPSGRIPLR